MRWKLLVLAPLLAALVGAGAPLGVVLAVSGTLKRPVGPTWLVAVTLFIPLATALAAGFFVYRHTARRRALQAMIAALLTIFLIITVLLAGAFFFRDSRPAPSPVPRPRNVG